MELEITKFINEIDTIPPLYGSIAQYGENASEYTWNNALNYAIANPLLAFRSRDYVISCFRSFGAWSDKNLNNFTSYDLDAMLYQYIAGEYQEYLLNPENSTIFQNENKFYVYIGE